jgi:starch-binding outer membrane protein, SusD/RagB family
MIYKMKRIRLQIRKTLPDEFPAKDANGKNIRSTSLLAKLGVIVLFLITLTPGCDVLDVEPYHSIPADQAITTKKDVESAINGCYASFQSADYYGRNYLVVGDLTADILTWTGTTAGYNQIDNNSILADNVIVEGIWRSIYAATSRINITAAQIPSVEGLSTQEANSFLAELYFLRALAHFDLVKLFGPVAIRTTPATISDEDLNAPRQTVDRVYEQIFSDLAFAETHIRSNIIRGKASKASVLALKARASLYYYAIDNNTDLLNDAVDAATQVIDDFGLSLTPSYAALFNGNPNSESIFEIDFNEQDRNRLAEYFFPTSLSGRREFAPTTRIFNFYPLNDTRRDASISIDGANLYCIKYSDIETGTDNVYVFRLAEMYLIRAEANVLLNTSLPQARDDINEIRLRAGIPEIITTSPFLLDRQIRDMRKLEFAFEGHRWFDLVRTGRALDELEGVTELYQTLFPIPLSELLTNFNEGMYQNEGY